MRLPVTYYSQVNLQRENRLPQLQHSKIKKAPAESICRGFITDNTSRLVVELDILALKDAVHVAHGAHLAAHGAGILVLGL